MLSRLRLPGGNRKGGMDGRYELGCFLVVFELVANAFVSRGHPKWKGLIG